MPVYEWRCPNCQTPYQSQRALGDLTPPTCPTCQTPVRRRYSSIAFKLPMPEHYNASVGAYVSNETQFKDHLKVQSEQATLRTGLEHNFVPHDPRESKQELGITEEGLEATYRRRRELGLPTGEETHSSAGRRPAAKLVEGVIVDDDTRDTRDDEVEATMVEVQWLP